MSADSVYPARGEAFVVEFWATISAPITGFVPVGVADRTGAGVVPPDWEDWDPEDLTAVEPVFVIPEMRRTWSPPPLSPEMVAVNVVEVADETRLSRTATIRRELLLPDVMPDSAVW